MRVYHTRVFTMWVYQRVGLPGGQPGGSGAAARGARQQQQQQHVDGPASSTERHRTTPNDRI